MSEQLFNACYEQLNNPKLSEEERVDVVENLTREAFPQLKGDELERLVLDVLMAHHHGKPPAEAARSQKITTTQSVRVRMPVIPASNVEGASVVKLPSDAVPKPNASPFDELREVFGQGNSDEEIERVLAHNDFDFARTIDLLAGEQTELELSKEQTASRIMCRYYIAGHCVRGDQCMYSHDGSHRICRFWLHQRCVAGDMCLFMHGIPRLPEKYQAKRRVVKQPQLTLDALKSLPSLGSRPRKPSAEKAKPIFAGTASNGSGSGSANSTEITLDLKPISEVLGQLNTGLVPLVKPRLVPWLVPEFGHNQEYIDLRDEAALCAEQRNKLLQQSTNSWSSNDSAQAKELSARGREQEQKMMKCNRDAAELLWAQRSLPSSEIWVDLHGMQLIDAVEDLKAKLEHIARTEKHQPRCVYAITGRGHFYAKKYTDQMTQYVRALLDSEGYKHRDFGVTPQYGRITAIDPWSKMRDIKYE